MIVQYQGQAHQLHLYQSMSPAGNALQLAYLQGNVKASGLFSGGA